MERGRRTRNRPSRHRYAPIGSLRLRKSRHGRERQRGAPRFGTRFWTRIFRRIRRARRRSGRHGKIPGGAIASEADHIGRRNSRLGNRDLAMDAHRVGLRRSVRLGIFSKTPNGTLERELDFRRRAHGHSSPCRRFSKNFPLSGAHSASQGTLNPLRFGRRDQSRLHGVEFLGFARIELPFGTRMAGFEPGAFREGFGNHGGIASRHVERLEPKGAWNLLEAPSTAFVRLFFFGRHHSSLVRTDLRPLRHDRDSHALDYGGNYEESPRTRRFIEVTTAHTPLVEAPPSGASQASTGRTSRFKFSAQAAAASESTDGTPGSGMRIEGLDMGKDFGIRGIPGIVAEISN